MALSVKIDPVEKVTAVSLRRDLSTPEARKIAADFARAGLEEAKRINQRALGRVPPYTQTVDGKAGAPLESVNPDGGSIIFEFELVTGVLQWIARELTARSPVVSGAYRAGHKLFADGAETTLGGNIPPADEYVFLNAVPYARKIEVGKTEAGRSFVIQVQNKIYQRTASDARKQFGPAADIRFEFRQTTKAYTLRRSQGRHRARQAGSAISAPAIIVKSKKS